MESFEIASDLLASPDEVWPHLLNMESINAELSPIRMSYPPRSRYRPSTRGRSR